MNTPEYKLKARNEDFEVTEVPLLPRFLEKGSFTYVWLKKSGFYTFDALEAIGEHFELFYEDMAAEGLKDEDGITSQIISIKKSLKQTDMSAFNKKHSNKASSYILMERIMGYGDAPVAEKMLHGNSFNLVVRNLKDDVAARIEEFCKKNKFVTFVNYYDSQRFGLPGGPYNTHLIGKAIVEEDWKEAYEQLLVSKNKAVVKSAIEDHKSFFAAMNPKKVGFFVSSYDSYHWNIALSRELQKACDGQACSFENVPELFLPHGDAFAAKNIFVYKGHRIGEDMKIVPKDNSRCSTVSTAVYVLENGDDEMNEGRKKVRLAFFLPTGCYATMCVRQLIQKVTITSK